MPTGTRRSRPGAANVEDLTQQRSADERTGGTTYATLAARQRGDHRRIQRDGSRHGSPLRAAGSLSGAGGAPPRAAAARRPGLRRLGGRALAVPTDVTDATDV